MSTKTTHIVPTDGGWAIRKEGEHHVQRVNGVYSTQKQAMEVARDLVQRSPAGQVVVHGRNGSMKLRYVHGLPVVQKPPRKSDLGTSAIKKAVSTVIRQRLEAY
jgi:Uncharacterized protein conserved in bacteria (DUF2188)